MATSEAASIAERAPEYIDEMLLQLIKLGRNDSDSVCLGTLISNRNQIQIQLVITNDPTRFLDD